MDISISEQDPSLTCELSQRKKRNKQDTATSPRTSTDNELEAKNQQVAVDAPRDNDDGRTHESSEESTCTRNVEKDAESEQSWEIVTAKEGEMSTGSWRIHTEPYNGNLSVKIGWRQWTYEVLSVTWNARIHTTRWHEGEQDGSPDGEQVVEKG
ncbi:hypothetical protein HIM_03226 [Hirsutella minnesotensis 3608]|nr:hypothetical protein HIM_03226 [Hirsutella minnesotensis 3608]